MKENYTKKEVIELLVKFGEHCVEQATGAKVELIGELHNWVKENKLDDNQNVSCCGNCHLPLDNI